MAGLGLFIFGAMSAVCGIGRAIENKQMKDYSSKIDEQGRPTWIDREGNQYINGEKVIATYDYKNKKLVYAGQITGTVYIDPEQNQINIMDERSKKWMEDNKKLGFLAYDRWYPQCENVLTTEMSTGKILAYIYEDKNKNIYRKFYLKHMPESSHSLIQTEPGDFGVPISKEEYKKLNYVCNHYGCLDTEMIFAIGTEKDPYRDVHPE